MRFLFSVVTLVYSHQAREDLEQQSLEVASTAEAVSFITDVQALKRKIKNWERQVEVGCL